MNRLILENLKKKKQIERKYVATIRELILYACFMWILFIITYSKMDPKSFTYNDKLADMFVRSDEFNQVIETFKLKIDDCINKLNQ